MDPFRFVLIAVAGWMNQRQLQAMDYLKEENRLVAGATRAACGSPTTSVGGWPLRPRDWEERCCRKCHDCDAGDIAGLASETGRGEVRREREAEAGAAAQSRGTGGTGGPHGSGKSELGLPAHPGCLSNLGYEIAGSTIAAILRRHGMELAPERSRKTTWKEFLTQHCELIAAADFFTIEAWTDVDYSGSWSYFSWICPRASWRLSASPPTRTDCG